MTLEEIRAAFPGYHVEIELFPAGGRVTAECCEECGTWDSAGFSAPWRIKRGETAADAVRKVRAKLGL